MLLELADLLSGWYRGFHLFQYLTFRAIMSTLTALTVSLLFGPLIIRKLADLKAGQVVRSDGPQSHLTKAGTSAKPRPPSACGRRAWPSPSMCTTTSTMVAPPSRRASSAGPSTRWSRRW